MGLLDSAFAFWHAKEITPGDLTLLDLTGNGYDLVFFNGGPIELRNMFSNGDRGLSQARITYNTYTSYAAADVPATGLQAAGDTGVTAVVEADFYLDHTHAGDQSLIYGSNIVALVILPNTRYVRLFINTNLGFNNFTTTVALPADVFGKRLAIRCEFNGSAGANTECKTYYKIISDGETNYTLLDTITIANNRTVKFASVSGSIGICGISTTSAFAIPFASVYQVSVEVDGTVYLDVDARNIDTSVDSFPELSASAQTVTLRSATTTTPGLSIDQEALNFTNDSSVYSTDTGLAFPNKAEFTAMFYVNRPKLIGTRWMFGWEPSSASRWSVGFSAGEQVEVKEGSTLTATGTTARSRGPMTMGGVFDAVNAYPVLNGVKEGAGGARPNRAVSGSRFYLGAGYTPLSFYGGAIWDSVLSDADLLAAHAELMAYGVSSGGGVPDPVHSLLSGQLQHGAMGFAPRHWRS